MNTPQFSVREMALLINDGQLDESEQYWVDHRQTVPEASELSLELNDELRNMKSSYVTHILTEEVCPVNGDDCQFIDNLQIYKGYTLVKSFPVPANKT